MKSVFGSGTKIYGRVEKYRNVLPSLESNPPSQVGQSISILRRSSWLYWMMSSQYENIWTDLHTIKYSAEVPILLYREFIVYDPLRHKLFVCMYVRAMISADYGANIRKDASIQEEVAYKEKYRSKLQYNPHYHFNFFSNGKRVCEMVEIGEEYIERETYSVVLSQRVTKWM